MVRTNVWKWISEYTRINGNLLLTGHSSYLPRRDIVKELGLNGVSDLEGDIRYRENKFPLIATSEVLLLTDKADKVRLKEQPIYIISEDSYGVDRK